MVDQARLIRDFPDAEERIAESRKMIQALLYDQALDNINQQDKQRILEYLRFATAPCAPENVQPLPAYQDEEAENKLLEEEGKATPKKQQTFFFMP